MESSEFCRKINLADAAASCRRYPPTDQTRGLGMGGGKGGQTASILGIDYNGSINLASSFPFIQAKVIEMVVYMENDNMYSGKIDCISIGG